MTPDVRPGRQGDPGGLYFQTLLVILLWNARTVSIDHLRLHSIFSETPCMGIDIPLKVCLGNIRRLASSLHVHLLN
jgi:hypothetical protein